MVLQRLVRVGEFDSGMFCHYYYAKSWGSEIPSPDEDPKLTETWNNSDYRTNLFAFHSEEDLKTVFPDDFVEEQHIFHLAVLPGAFLVGERQVMFTKNDVVLYPFQEQGLDDDGNVVNIYNGG